MKQRQSLTEYVINEMKHHMEMRQEDIVTFSFRTGISAQRLKIFMAGLSSIRLDTADRILSSIEKAKTEKA